MNVSRPKAGLLGLAVLGVLIAGCQPATDPAAASTTSPTVAPAFTDDATDTADPAVAVLPTTPAPATTAAKPAATTKPAVKPTTHQPAPKPTTKKPTPKPKPKPTTEPPAGPIVHPGAFCKPEGAIGFTSKGTRMRCTLKAGEKQPRWRAA
jgi:outer membrane biosynthesis protein TonB